MTEAQFQAKVVTWLKHRGFYVIKTKPGPGVPVGCPDVVGLMAGGGWVALEVKASEKATDQPLQKVTVKKLNSMYYSRRIYPDIWAEVRKEIVSIL